MFSPQLKDIFPDPDPYERIKGFDFSKVSMPELKHNLYSD